MWHLHATPKAKPETEPTLVSASSTERGEVEPTEKQGHWEILCERSYEKKERNWKTRASISSSFYFPTTLKPCPDYLCLPPAVHRALLTGKIIQPSAACINNTEVLTVCFLPRSTSAALAFRHWLNSA